MDDNDNTWWRRHVIGPEESQQFDRLVGAAEQQRIKALIDDPDLGKLLDEDLFVAVARADVLPRLLTWFTAEAEHATEGWAHHPERSGAIGTASAAVEWTFTGSYNPSRLDAQQREVPNAASFNGVRALGQSIKLDGVTLMSIEDNTFVMRRYIDWVGLYTQLGLSMNWRVRQGAGRRVRS